MKYPICPRCGEIMMPIIDQYYHCSKCNEEHISYEGEGEEREKTLNDVMRKDISIG